MQKKLGNYELLEQIDPGGYTVVYRAREVMGHGVSRPAAVKLLQGWKADDPEQIAALRREVSVLAELSACPNIVTIYGFDIDAEMGPWIAMELGGKSLRKVITEGPSDPVKVRQLLRDILRALTALHGATPPVLHRDLKPNNILATDIGTWKLADFGLAKRSDTESTLNVLTVQYAAPELLDASLGKEGPWTDLYSLGLIAYELALGTTQYKAQFPSVYDPYATPEATRVDERPKWMYWHTSPQMTLKPLAELIPEYPKDLSDLIAAMVVKPVDQRVPSAQEALGRLRETPDAPSARGSMLSLGGRREAAAPERANTLIVGVAAAAGLAIVGMLGTWLYLEIGSRPVITLSQRDGRFKSDGPVLQVTGRIRNMPNRAVASIVTADGARVPVLTDLQGKFTAEVTLAKLGEMSALLRLTEGTARLAELPLTLERAAPKSVKVVVNTVPPTPNVEFTVIQGGPEAKPQIALTNDKGVAEISVAYGRFEARLTHPRFTPASRQYETGADPTKSITANLVPLAPLALNQARRSLLTAADEAADGAASGSPESIETLERTRRELSLLEGDAQDSEARRRVSLIGEMIDVSKRSVAGDERAKERLSELRTEVQEIIKASLADLGSDRRQAIMRELVDTVERGVSGDTSAADRLAQIRAEIGELDAQEGAGVGEAAQRARVLNEMYDLCGRAARGETIAAATLRESLRQLQTMPVPTTAGGPTNRRRRLMEEMSGFAREAASGNAVAIKDLRRVKQSIEDLDRGERVSAPIASRRSRFLSDIVNLAESASKGDVQAALRMRQVEEELLAMDAGKSAGTSLVERGGASLDRRAALVREIADLRRQVAHEPRAADRVRQIRSELQAIEVAESSSRPSAVVRRRMDLLTELGEVTELASGSDSQAIERLGFIQRELAVLVAIEQAAGDPDRFADAATAMMGTAPSLGLMDRGVLMQLPDDQFLSFVESVSPSGGVKAEVVPNLRRLRLRGVVLTQGEMDLLTTRLEPAAARLMMEVRVDPWALRDELERALEAEGFQSVRVHPYLRPTDAALYVQCEPPAGRTLEDARRVASSFVIDEVLLVVQAVPKSPPAPASAPSGAASARP